MNKLIFICLYDIFFDFIYMIFCIFLAHILFKEYADKDYLEEILYHP